MTYAALRKEIQSNKFKSVYLLHGEEHYFIDQIASLLEERVVPEHARAFNQMILYGKEIDGAQLLAQVRRFPVMAERQLVVLREAQQFSHWDHLASYLERPVASSVLVISFKSVQNKKKIDKRKKWYKTLSKLSDAAILEAKPIYDNKIPQWILDFMKNAGFSMHPSTAQTIGAYVGTELNTLVNELNKLVLLKDKGQEITMDDVEKNIGISKSYNVFELQKALGARDITKSQAIALNLGDHLKDQPIFLLMASLMNYFQKVYSGHTLKGKPDPQWAQALGVHPFFVKDYKQATARFTPAQLDSIFKLMYKTDLALKGIDGSRTSDRALWIELVNGILYA